MRWTSLPHYLQERQKRPHSPSPYWFVQAIQERREILFMCYSIRNQRKEKEKRRRETIRKEERGYNMEYQGINMDLNALAALKKQKVKVPGQKEPSKQKPLGEFSKKGSEPSEEAAKRKAAGKAPIPEGKRPKKGDVGKKAPRWWLWMSTPLPSPVLKWQRLLLTCPRVRGGEVSLPREDIRFSLPKGAAITHGTVDPREFLGGATPALDRKALGKLDDEALESKILRSSLTACIALGEYARRFDEWRLQKAQQNESLKKLIHDNAEAMRQMAQLEWDLQQARAAAEKAVKEKAEVEKAATEAARKAYEDAEAAKTEAAAGVVAAFMAEGWKAKGHKDWAASVVEGSADGWVNGPGVMWLARNGEDYYAGGNSSPRL
ncbi:unnamed protein product [Cuscuta europaea]|uniref:Uncharacterized protein n=1 Tax=Cuscuta europaea TaxID=41803 RepID=A0A9P0ZM34_CUSEU|nr:unnamed protein product [Cuscuta europaea]